MPDFIPPQLATLVKEPPAGDEWLHELKFDGYRMLCHLNDGQVRFWSRNRKDWTHKFPTLGKAINALSLTSAIFDGEVVAIEADGRSSFQKLQQSIKTGDSGFVFQIFDLIYLAGFNLTRTPLRERKRLLSDLLESVKKNGPLRYSDHVAGNGATFLKQACKFGLEGIVSKFAEAPYESTRSHNWLKIKCIRRQEFVIVGYTPSEKGLPGFGALVLGVYAKGKLIYAGRAGTGFSFQDRLELKKKLDRLVRATSPLAEMPKDPGLRPREVVREEPSS